MMPEDAMSAGELKALQLRTLFMLDPDGRIRAVNEPDGAPPPRFYLGRTRAGNLCRCRFDLDPHLEAELCDIAASEPPGHDLEQPPTCLPALEVPLGRQAPVTHREAGPAYRFPAGTQPAAGVIEITQTKSHLLAAGFPALLAELEARGPCLAVVADGAAVSVCYCSRRTVRAAEAGVETLEGYRGRGLATAVTASWVHAVRRDGRIPLYSTTWDNLASRGVARHLGLIRYGADLDLT